jgi:hypothetical protein
MSWLDHDQNLKTVIDARRITKSSSIWEVLLASGHFELLFADLKRQKVFSPTQTSCCLIIDPGCVIINIFNQDKTEPKALTEVKD